MPYTIKTTKRFEKNLKRCQRRGYPMEEFRKVITLLSTDGKLPQIYKPHKLKGKWKDNWECHITPDWLLVWEIQDEALILLLIGTGSHSDLF